MRSQCSFIGCARFSRRNGLCDSHDHQAKRGVALKPIGEWCKPRGMVDDVPGSETLRVPLTRGRFAIIDRSDGEAVGARNWHARRCPGTDLWYAETNLAGGGLESLHRFLWHLWGLPDTPEVDHANRDGLDCRRENLRAATLPQNRWNARKRSDNTSGHKGIDRQGSQWRARIAADGKKIYLGLFDDIGGAVAAVERARQKLHADFARSA